MPALACILVVSITMWHSKNTKLWTHAPDRPPVLGSDTIQPVISGHEVASRISNNRTVQLLERFDHVFPESILIRQWVTRIVEATVDTAAHVSIIC